MFYAFKAKKEKLETAVTVQCSETPSLLQLSARSGINNNNNNNTKVNAK